MKRVLATAAPAMDLNTLFNGNFVQSRQQLEQYLMEIEASFRHDLPEKKKRPSAPWDALVTGVSQIKDSLELVNFAWQLKKECQPQARRSGVSTRSQEIIARLEQFLESLFTSFTLDFEKASQALQAASVENIREGRTVPDKDTQALVNLLSGELIEPGNFWEPRNEFFHPGTIVDQYRANAEHHSSLFETLPIHPSAYGYLDLRAGDSAVQFLTWQDLLNDNDARKTFWADAVFMAADLSWILIFCHSGFAVFSERNTGH